MKKYMYPLSLMILSLAGWLLVWDKLPESISFHIGGIDYWHSSTLNAFFVTNGLLMGFILVAIILPKINPNKGFTKSYYMMIDLITSLLFLMSAGAISISIGMGFNEKTLVMGSMGILLTLIVVVFLLATTLFVTLMVALVIGTFMKIFGNSSNKMPTSPPDSPPRKKEFL